MADNITLDAGSGGDTVQADDLGTYKIPAGKITLGADGVDDGFVSSANPLPISDADGSVTVDGTVTANAGSGTFAVSAASLPLPTGAATAAKQPAPGTAGTASADVLTVQGVAGMTAILVDGSGVTQPVSAASLPLPTGAATAANQTTANTALAAIQAAVETLDNAISGAEMQVDVVSGTVTIQDGGGSITVDGTVAISGTVAVSDGGGALTVDNAGTFAVQASQSGTWTVNGAGGTFPVTDSGGSLTVDLPAVASGGATPFRLVSAATTNATSLKASAGTLYALVATNTNAAARYLKLYDKATAPTVGTDTPVLTICVPGNTAGAGVVLPIPACGLAFANGIAYATTTGAADSDTAAVAANELIVAGAYK